MAYVNTGKEKYRGLLKESKMRHEAPRGPSHRAGNAPVYRDPLVGASPDQQDRIRGHMKQRGQEMFRKYRLEQEQKDTYKEFRRRVRRLKKSGYRRWPPGEEPYIYI